MNRLSVYNKVMFFVLTFFVFFAKVNSQEVPYTKIFFENSNMAGSFYDSNVTYSGESWVKNLRSKLPVSYKHSFTKGNSIELEYKSSNKGDWSVTVLYDKIRGISIFNPATHLSFWVYINNVQDIETLPTITLLEDNEEDHNVLLINDQVNVKEKDWQRILIPLTSFVRNYSVENITGVRFSQGKESSITNQIFIDQIELVDKSDTKRIIQKPEIISSKGYRHHIDIKWKPCTDKQIRYVRVYRSSNINNEFKEIGVQSPWISGYTDFIKNEKLSEYHYKITFLDKNYIETESSNITSSKTRLMTNEEYLTMIQESNFRYYWEGAEPNSGMALENIPGRTSMVATGASGFGIMALIVGTERGFISREESVDRFLKITNFLIKVDKFHGAFPHFLDGQTGKVVTFFGSRDNGGDLVETSFLVQGLLTAKEYFNGKNDKEKEIRKTITKICNDVEWDWYRRQPYENFLTWHWSPDQEWIIDHKLIGWNETMITYFLAIASKTHGVPASLYYSGWASQSELAQKYRSSWGKTKDGSLYTNGKTYYGIELPAGVANGGPLFFVHYSFLGLNPHMVDDNYVNYFENNKRIALINQRYCIENPKNHRGYGENFWGLTASDGPNRYFPNEPRSDKDDGKMTPTGALASFPYTPEASMNALKNYYENYGEFLYGYYGFKDAFSLDENWCSTIYMGLNQAPITIMIENYRTGLIWNLFMQNEVVKNGLNKLDFNKKL